ncbi:unnamed protein product [Citrullus colocynthis]|uniref:Uncharacterized protein n=1 Tax=Citrullus colocynthis TaxID=252529 RepID=A0ABP0XSS2_9ROSI
MVVSELRKQGFMFNFSLSILGIPSLSHSVKWALPCEIPPHLFKKRNHKRSTHLLANLINHRGRPMGWAKRRL